MLSREVKEIAVSAVVIAAAFAIALNGGFSFVLRPSILSFFLLAIVAVAFSFILHELAHRFVARRYGHFAEYRMWSPGLLLAVFLSFFGFVFAAPGAVVIHDRADMWGKAIPLEIRKYGIISVAGPLTNIILAFAFYLLSVLSPSQLWSVGVTVNLWLAAFNLLPIPPLDGSKVFAWSKLVWLIVIAASAVPLFFFL